MNAIKRSILACSVFCLNLSPLVSQAMQPENPVACVEGSTISIGFGDHTTNCELENPTDRDRFQFSASGSDMVRVIVLSGTNGLDPVVEVRGPNGPEIVGTSFCSGNIPGRLPFRCSFSVDITPSISGKHTLAISDSGFNEEGNYETNLQCLFRICPDDETPPPPASLPGDIDLDGDVDHDDLDLLLAARNTLAVSEDDKRDLDGDGKITAKDARILTTLCTNSLGAVFLFGSGIIGLLVCRVRQERLAL